MQGAIAGAKELLKNVSDVEDIDSISSSGELIITFFFTVKEIIVECKEYVNFIDHPKIYMRLLRTLRSKYLLLWALGFPRLEARASFLGLDKLLISRYQCSGSGSTGSTCFWASRIRNHLSQVWIRLRIRLSSCKNSKKNLDSFYFVTLFDFLSLKNDVNVSSKSNK